jgi:hypothetical protein
MSRTKIAFNLALQCFVLAGLWSATILAGRYVFADDCVWKCKETRCYVHPDTTCYKYMDKTAFVLWCLAGEGGGPAPTGVMQVEFVCPAGCTPECEGRPSHASCPVTGCFAVGDKPVMFCRHS